MTSELLFGKLAGRLEARSERTRPDELRLLCAQEELAGELRMALAQLHLELAPRRGMLRLRGPAEVLGDPKGSLEGLEILRRTHENAVAPRRPPLLMGILNVTSDSFSDGGRLPTPEAAVEHGLKLRAQGAEILDVGGESTRPGAASVSEAEEMRRVLPVIEELAGSTSACISVDTTKSEVARAALDAGATMVNDVSAGRFDPAMLPLIAERGARVVLMHMQGTPLTMQRAPHYEDVVREVTKHLRERVGACLKAGIPLPKINVDPGIGFGKRVQDNLDLIRGLPELRSLGVPIVLGVSRKSFLGQLSGQADPGRRDPETQAAVALACELGADIHRVHDVAGAASALAIAQAVSGIE